VADTDRVYLHNDTDAGAIGERFYRDDPPTDMVYLTISSGIGAGVFVGGDLLVGANGNAGEVGHITVDAAGTMTCRCGTPGHWEAYCSGHNVPRYARVLFERGDWSLAPAASGVGTDEPTADADADADPDLDGDGDGDGVEREGRGDPPAGVTHGDAADPASGTAARATALPVFDDGFDAATVYDAAGTDPLADRVLERLGEWNAIGVADLVHSFAPDLVAVGGAVALNNPDAVLDPIRRRLPDRVYVDVPRVELTALGDEVVLKGALASALTGGAGGTDA
jgi:glucokinase